MTETRRIAITGDRRGIGRHLCEHYLARGHTVHGISRQPTDLSHERYTHITADIADDSAVRAALAEIASRGRLDLLVNNASLKLNSYGLLTSAVQAQQMIQTNLLGTFSVTREALKVMKRHRFGRVVTLSSVAVPLTSAGTAIYGASKAAVEQMTAVLAREVAADDITLNTVGISVFPDSEMVRTISEEQKAALERALLKPRPLSIEEIAHAVDFFASPLASCITGQTIYFGGAG